MIITLKPNKSQEKFIYFPNNSKIFKQNNQKIVYKQIGDLV